MNYRYRTDNIKKLLLLNGLDAVIISSVPNITYLTGYSNFSSLEREAFLLVTKTCNYIFTDGRYAYAKSIQQLTPHWKLILITADNSFETAFSNIAASNQIKNIGIEEENISIREEKFIIKAFKNLHNFSISSLRIQKDFSEIESINEACKIGDLAFKNILQNISKGITEQELAFELEMFIKRKGADLSFPSIVAFGSGSAIPHYATSNTQRLKSNSIILLDFGVKYNNYCSDMTRTIFYGKANDEFKKMYETVKIAQKKSIDFLESRIRNQELCIGKDVDAIARQHIIDAGFPTIPHSLGHGIGLEVHEAPSLSPKSSDELKEGMVFSIEPGIYWPRPKQSKTSLQNFGGVRIEDLVTIQNRKLEILTNSPKELIEISVA